MYLPSLWARLIKTRKPLVAASDEQMLSRETLALEFYQSILAPDEDPAFVSDEATLRDVSWADDQHLARKVAEHYGHQLAPWDFQRSFWSLLDELQRSRNNRPKS